MWLQKTAELSLFRLFPSCPRGSLLFVTLLEIEFFLVILQIKYLFEIFETLTVLDLDFLN